MTRPKGSADSAETDAASESRESLLSLPSRKEEKPCRLKPAETELEAGTDRSV